MQRVNEFVFYELAIKLHSLVELADAPIKYSSCWYSFWNARKSIDDIYLQRPLNFTTQAALRLYQAISSVVPVNWDELMSTYKERTKEPEEPIAQWVITEIRE